MLDNAGPFPVFKLSSPLTGGTTYAGTQMHGHDCTASSSVTTTAAVDLPSTLGTLTYSVGERQVFEDYESGSCFTTTKGIVATVDLTLSEEAGPWVNALMVRVVVNDEVYRYPQDAFSVGMGGLGRRYFGDGWFPWDGQPFLIPRVRVVDKLSPPVPTRISVEAWVPGAPTTIAADPVSVDFPFDDTSSSGLCALATNPSRLPLPSVLATLSLLSYRRRP